MRIRISVGSSRERSVAEALAGGLVCTGLSVVGFYVAFGGGELVSGIPFVPDAWNRIIGRTVVALGAVVTACLAIYAFRDAYLLRRANKT